MGLPGISLRVVYDSLGVGYPNKLQATRRKTVEGVAQNTFNRLSKTYLGSAPRTIVIVLWVEFNRQAQWFATEPIQNIWEAVLGKLVW